MDAQFKRKKIFVDRGLQVRFTIFVILFVLISSLLTGLTVFYTTFTMLGDKLADVYPQGRLSEISRSAYVGLAINMLIILPFIIYGSIKFSHRIAGPLPKIYEALRQIGQGNFDVNLVLRKRDELRDLALQINDTAKNLKEREAKK